ncbi:MAG: pyridine nucleotide-disulfide oxidoreductase/dicluster-binding protein [Desulfopila sp.]
MDQKELRELEARCIQEEPPACRAGCPLGVDGRGFARAMADNRPDTARGILEKSIPLLSIVARLCEAPCEQYCLRKELGGAIDLRGLELACITASQARGKLLKLPPRAKTVAIIGGGPSGLTAAFDLARKGYPVTLYHLAGRPGGWLVDLTEQRLPAQALTAELSRLATLGIRFAPVKALSAKLYASLETDGVYIGSDDAIAADLAAITKSPDPQTFAVTDQGLFAGGLCPSDHPYRLITDIFQGREAALSIDRFLQGASLTASRPAPRRGRTDLFTRTEGIAAAARVTMMDPAGYALKEAVAEAGRCLDCQCLECVHNCVFLAEYRGYPKTYARLVYNNSAIVKGVHQANTFINSCALCGQCETLCPNDFSMAELCLRARQQMVDEQRMPPSAHWFALEEMRSAREEMRLVQHAPGQAGSRWLFFPGCQLSGIRPEQTARLYDRLIEIEPRTGIWLDCCGAPGHWSGRVQEFTVVVEQLQASWQAMGRPRLLTGCSTCLTIFREHLPAAEAESVWSILAKEPFSAAPARPPLALSDPCTSRHDQETRMAVRELLDGLGQPLAPLAMAAELTECCGFGGLMAAANPALARKVSEARVAQTDAALLTYCAMCRDRLAATGKPVLHLLDLLFADVAVAANAPPVSSSDRRVNRRRLHRRLLARYPDHQLPPAPPWATIELTIPTEVAALLESRRILEDDIRQVLHEADRRGHTFAHGTDGRQIASARLGEVTFWVEYRHEGKSCRLLSCWSHRMTISHRQAVRSRS